MHTKVHSKKRIIFGEMASKPKNTQQKIRTQNVDDIRCQRETTLLFRVLFISNIQFKIIA